MRPSLRGDMQEAEARGRRRAMPTLGATILCVLLAAWIGWQAVQEDSDNVRIAREARIDACVRGNDLRDAVRVSNRIVADLLETVAAPRTAEYRRARAALIRHVRANPRDPVAVHAELATRPNYAASAAVAHARAELARQDRLLAPVVCEDATP